MVEIEYVPRAELQPLEDPAAALEPTLAALAGLESADWVATCHAIATLRQLIAHSPETCEPHL